VPDGVRCWDAYSARVTTRHRLPLSALLLAICLNVQAHAQETEAQGCFDLEVTARIVDQVPTVMPEFEDGSIVMRWPWFMDLDVRSGKPGALAKGKLTVLTLQHTYWTTKRYKRWLLRRNDLGTFNLVGSGKEATLSRCPANTPPASAYIRPTEGGSLENLRREGEERFGRRPS